MNILEIFGVMACSIMALISGGALTGLAVIVRKFWRS